MIVYVAASGGYGRGVIAVARGAYQQLVDVAEVTVAGCAAVGVLTWL